MSTIQLTERANGRFGNSEAPALEPLTISVMEFRRISGLSHCTVYQLIREGRLDSIKIGAKRLIKYPSAKTLLGA